MASGGLIITTFLLAAAWKTQPGDGFFRFQSFLDSGFPNLSSEKKPSEKVQKLLLVSRDGLNLKNQDFTSLYDQEARCIEGLLAKGARAVGILQKDPATQREKFLRQKLGRTQGVVLFPVEGSFLKTFPPSDRRLEVRYPVGTTFHSFVSRMLKAAALPPKQGFVRVDIRDAVESPVLNLSHLQRILQDPKRSQELVAQRLIVLTPHRDLIAWREWQCLQTVVGGGPLAEAPKGFAGWLWTVAAWIAAPGMGFLPRGRSLRIFGWAGSAGLLSILWLFLSFSADRALPATQAIISWLTAGGLILLLWMATGLAHRFFPSRVSAGLCVLLQGTHRAPLPACWKRRLFDRPLPRLLPVQKRAAELLATSILGSPRLPGWVYQLLEQVDAISAVRIWTEQRR